MAEAVYLLCAVTSILCACLLLKGHRLSRTPLLFWSSLCFAALAINNVLLFVDRVLVPETDLGLLRTSVALVAMMVLMFGLVWETR